MYSNLEHYAQLIPRTPPRSIADLPTNLRIYADPTLEVWYTPMPFEYKQPKLWILGITPGWAQMRIAYEQAAIALEEGLSPAEAAARPKPGVAYAGSMRNNLVAMLDDLGMHNYLAVPTMANLFGTQWLQTGSALRYPVFTKGKNYNGHTPKPLAHPALREMLYQLLTNDLRNTGHCLILPLGRAVEEMLDHLVAKGTLAADRLLSGFPHPSGANGHRRRQYQEHKADLKRQMACWFESTT